MRYTFNTEPKTAEPIGEHATLEQAVRAMEHAVNGPLVGRPIVINGVSFVEVSMVPLKEQA